MVITWMLRVPESQIAIRVIIDIITACLKPAAIVPSEIFPATRPLIIAMRTTGGRNVWTNSGIEM